MTLTNFTLQNFRSYPKKTISLSPTVTLIVGPNTAGKTNILEAIFAVATGKSFRADKESEVIAWGTEVSRVTCRVSGGSDDVQLEMVWTNGIVQSQKAPLKKYLVNGIARRQIDFVGNLRAVLFWPEHLDLVTGSPSLRRRYLDSVLIQVDREYRRHITVYEQALRQRNKLLDLISEGKAHRSQLSYWDEVLIGSGNYITNAREVYLDFVNSYHMSGVTYHVAYDKSVISESRLAQYKDAEVAAHVTLVGPHRDDFVVQGKRIKEKGKMEDEPKELSKYGSRGEQRLGVLWLKLAELDFIEQKTGARPLLLLDDIFSELDEDHRELVIALVDKQQTILTSAEQDSLPESLSKKAEMIQLS